MEEPTGRWARIVEQLGNYGYLIVDGLQFMIVGMVMVMLLQKAATKFIYPHLKRPKALMVLFGALYLLVLVIAVLLVLQRAGYDVSVISKLALLTVIVGAVLAFFLLPFLPTLPFKIGNMVDIGGMVGVIDAITYYHTHLRTFDGRMVFIPNALVVASKIVNYHHTPTRRIELALGIDPTGDRQRAVELLMATMRADERVIADPAPSVICGDAGAERVNLVGYCWVHNGDWLSAKSDLWLALLDALDAEPRVAMALPKQEVHLRGAEPAA